MEPVSVDVNAIFAVATVIVAPNEIVVPVATSVVSGAIVSTMSVTVPVEKFPAGSVIVIIGFDPMSTQEPIQVTVPPVDGDGVHVVLSIEMVAPDSTSPVVIVTSPPLLGEGEVVVVGTVGMVWLVTVTVLVTVFPELLAVSV